MKNINEIDKKIAELKNQIQEWELKKAKYEKMPRNYRLAEALHDVQCTWNHADGCGWYYESWENPGFSRQEYLKKANEMLNEMTFEDAMKVIKFM